MGKSSSNFEAKIIRAGTQDEFPKFASVEAYKTGLNNETRKREYIVVQKDDEFEIKLQAPNSIRVYGVKLYIDGQYIHYKKTFKNRGYIRGYKLGAGLFRSFKFQVPDVAETEFQKKEQGEKPSTIRIEFYETRLRYVPKLHDRKRIDKDTYQAPKQFDDKKRYIRSLTVKNGGLRQFSVNLQRVNEYLYDPDKNMYKDHVIDEDNLLDTIEYGYSDFFTLQIRGLISLGNTEHFKLIPRELIKLGNKNLLVSIVETLISSNPEGVTFDELEKAFGKRVEIKWKEISNSSIQSFVELHLQQRSSFIDGKIRLNKEGSKGENLRKDLMNRRIESGIIPKFYFEVPKDRKMSKGRQILSRFFSKEFSNQTPLIQTDKPSIDLDLAAQMRGKQVIVIDDDDEPAPETSTLLTTPNYNDRMDIESPPRFSQEGIARPTMSPNEDPFRLEEEDMFNPERDDSAQSITSNFFGEEEDL